MYPRCVRACACLILTSIVVAPKVLSKVDPEYTKSAKDAGTEGTVVVDLEVHPDGRAHNMRIERSLDPGRHLAVALQVGDQEGRAGEGDRYHRSRFPVELK
ncbi:MAG: hypothetical protein DMG57_06945 [Acidobacteria bacterium]|nr:MAG: hypothetical protein DMG57_06945 [Acidobacteriota bacterium]